MDGQVREGGSTHRGAKDAEEESGHHRTVHQEKSVARFTRRAKRQREGGEGGGGGGGGGGGRNY
jgi:hypothetical protein